MATSTPIPVVSAPPTGHTNVPPPSDIRDIKPPVPMGGPGFWILLVAVLAALAAALLYWLRRRRRPVAATAPAIAPHTRARQRLEAALALLSQPEPFCVAVSAALREYLEDQFDLHAPERTTEEFLAELQTSALLDSAQKESLGDFLTRCDLVKFARYDPTESELLALHSAAVRLVNETEPRPWATSEPGSAPAAATTAGGS